MKVKLVFSNPTFFALFMLIIWDALKNYLGLHATAIQMMFLVPVIALGVTDWRNRFFLSTSQKKPLSIWLIWIVYSLLNTLVINDISILSKNPFILTSAIIISFIFILFICSSHLKTESLINLLILAYFARLLLSFIFDSGGFTGQMSRFGEEFNANTIAFGALFIIVLITIKRVQFSKTSIFDIALIGIAVLTIIVTGSRKNLLSVLFLAIAYLYIVRSQSTVKNILKFSFFGFVLAVATIWLLNNTYIGERTIGLFDRTAQARELNTPEKMFDNRARYYIEGWQLFKKHPVNGIGLTNFAYYDWASRSLHSEYMAQITEGGIIGSFIFVFFYISLLLKLFSIRKKHQNYKKTAEIYIGSVFIMLFLFTGAWIYRYPVLWVLVALSVRFVFEVESNEKAKKIMPS